MIARSSPVPLYYQLRQQLAARIAAGEWQPGDMLPTEAQLRAQYGVSRSTVRQALRELELEGTITRQRGKGTFVARAKLSHGPEPHLSLTTMLRQQGIVPGWRVVSAEWTPAPADVAAALGLPPTTPVFRLRRLRLADDDPIGYHDAHTSPVAATAIDRQQFAAGGSLDYLSGHGFLSGTVVERTIEAVPAAEDVAHLLGVGRGTPLLHIRRRLLSHDGTVIELLNALYRGDRFQYRIGPPTAE